jgi:hypothetical protein
VEGRVRFLAAGLRRFLVILAALSALTTVLSLLLALLARWDVDRAVSIGFDLVGVFLLVAGFFFGNRGPARLRGAGAAPFFGPRMARWATAEEREEALNDSAVFLAVGLVLVVIGIAIDSRYSLV